MTVSAQHDGWVRHKHGGRRTWFSRGEHRIFKGSNGLWTLIDRQDKIIFDAAYLATVKAHYEAAVLPAQQEKDNG